MLTYITLIFCCQLIGELLVSFTGLPVPGPVIGMLLLFTGLLLHGRLPEDLGRVADALITNLSLLFVPAGVGVMLHLQLLGNELVPISIALVASTLITIAVSGGMMLWLNRNRAAAGTDHGGEN